MGNTGDGTIVDRRRFLQAVGGASAGVALAGEATARHGGSGGGNDDRERIVVGISGEYDVAAFAELVEQGIAGDIPSDAEVVTYNRALNVAVLAAPRGLTLTDSSMLSLAGEHDAVTFTEPDDKRYDVPEPVAGSAGDGGRTADGHGEDLVSDPGDVAVAGTPDDPLFDEQYAPQQVDAPKAWDRVEGAADVTIAIVDQGVKYDHPDLEARFGDVPGRDFVADDDDPMPVDLVDEFHGTHVAGIAAATTDNDTGLAGLSDARLLSCRAVGPDGGRPSHVAAAIQWATDQGADVINLSLGGAESETVKAAVNYAFRNGALPVAAMGNSGGAELQYPAGYDNCLAVSAVDDDEDLADFSSTGDHVDVAAPGADVLSTWTREGGRGDDVDGPYARESGTSMATPAVAGVAALARAAQPDLPPAGLRKQLKATAVDVGLASDEQGAGRVDALQLVGATCDDTERPTARFTTDIADPHVGETVVCRSDSTDACGYIDTWEWDFGDGTTATGRVARHRYDEPGERTITLTVTDDEGQTHTTRRTVTVQPGGPGDLEHTEPFEGAIRDDGGRSEHTYAFRFDPSSLELRLESAEPFIWGIIHDDEVFTPDDWEGTLTVRDYDLNPAREVELVVVSSDRGDEPTGEYTLVLTEYGFGDGEDEGDAQPPEAAVSVSTTTPLVTEQFTVDATASADPDGSIETYAWEFGDGTQRTGEVVTHSYRSGGDYTVALTVTDDDGKRDRTTRTIQVRGGEAPAPAFTVDESTIPAGETITVDPSASADDVGIEQFNWDWGDGTTDATSTAEVLTHPYDEPGKYDVVLTVTDVEGYTESTARTVTVEPANEAPEAALSVSTTTPLVEDPITVDASGAVDPDGTIASLEWDFGDGTTATGRTAEHAYEAGETYTVSLTVTDDDGATDRATETIQVRGGEAPSPAFTVDETTVVAGAAVTVDPRASTDDVGIDTYAWDWGDGTSEQTDEAEPRTHTYTDPGEYEIRLRVTDREGTTASVARTVTVISPDGRQVDEYSGGLSTWWAADWYTVGTDLVRPASVEIALEGSTDADVDLYVTTDGRRPTRFDYDRKATSESSSETVELTKDIGADAEFGVLVQAFAPAGEYTLTVTEVGADGGDADGGDAGGGDDGDRSGDDGDRSGDGGDAGDGAEDGGDAGDDDGAGGTEPPTANAAADATDVRVGDSVTFDASGSTDPDGTIEGYSWDLGDGTTATGATVEHAYDAADTYTATLTVTDDAGATAQDTVAVTVTQESGADRASTTVSDTLRTAWDDDVWTYTPETAAPAQVTVELAGPADADFDLYAEVNGWPSRWDADVESTTPGSDETLVIEDVDAEDTIRLRVDSSGGDGDYDLTITERGR